ncbi:MAG: ATP-binding protein, partial [Persicimonas sp.]
GAVDAIRPRMRDFGHRFDLGPMADVWVDADATRLEQVISNLLDNAASYTAPGGRIELRVDADSDTVAIHVRDNGRGIDPEELESIFEPFHQGEVGPSRGLGIGLALTHQLIELHHGRVHAHSDGRGLGSEFVVELPRVDPPADLDESADAEPIAGVTDLAVLIVDDNVDAAELLAILLRNAGCKVTTAATGYDGLETARRQNFEVVLLDIGLPDLDGRQVARRLREAPGYEDACLIAISGYTQQQDLEDSKAAGFDAHLGKPVSQDELLRTMVAHCELPIEAPETSTDSTSDRLASTENAGEAAPTRGAGPQELPEVLEVFRQLDHDLRTPLSAIKMSGWTLGATQDAEAGAETAARLVRASELMTELIERANDLAALITRGEQALQREPADLDDVVESVLEQHISADDQPLAVSVSSHGPLHGRWDVARLRSVLSRIISRSCADSSRGLNITVVGEENTAAIELDLPQELPDLDNAFDEIDNLDSLHMDLNYAHWLVHAHAGNTSMERLDGHTLVRFELPRHR